MKPLVEPREGESVLDARLWSALLTMQRHSWEQGVASHAALDTGRTELAMALARDGARRIGKNLVLGYMGDGGLVNGHALLEALVLHVDDNDFAPASIHIATRFLVETDNRGPNGALRHLDGLDEAWADTVYMVVPSLVVVGAADAADAQYRAHRELLRNPRTGLWNDRQDWNEKKFFRQRYWGGASGWVAAGLARATRIADQRGIELKHRDGWIAEVEGVLHGFLDHEPDDARFHHVLDDEDDWLDNSGSLMAATAAFTGVAEGWLDSSWREHAARWLSAALRAVADDGVVGYVAGAPTFDAYGASPEAQAFAIMAREWARRAGVDPDA